MGTNSSKQIIGNYVIEKEAVLGNGSFGRVYKGFNQRNKQAVAMKECLILNSKERAEIHEEIANFQKIPQHPNIVKLLNYYCIGQTLWLVMEFCNHGDLENYMKNHSPDLEKQLKIMHQCAAGVAHMHQMVQVLIHRDIKPSNILLKLENGKEIAKIADFGKSKFSDRLTQTHTGTSLFKAPELVSRKKYDESVDIFALGLVFLSMIRFNPADGELKPLSETCLSSGNIAIPLGEEMVNASLAKGPMPVVIRSTVHDSPKKKALITLILQMTAFEPRQRKRMEFVVESLEQTMGIPTQGRKTTRLRDIVQLNFVSNLVLAKAKADDDSGFVEPDSAYENFRQVVLEVVEKQRRRSVSAPDEAAYGAMKEFCLTMPILTLFKLLDSRPADKFKVGDEVVLESNVTRAQTIQEVSGKWDEGIRMYLGKRGTVKKKANEEVLNVKFADGKVIALNALLLDKIEMISSKITPKAGDIEIYDIVSVGVTLDELRAQQEGHGGCDYQMERFINTRGVVRRIEQNGDVYVEFLGSVMMLFNPSTLVKEDTTAMEMGGGDLVFVDYRLENAKTKQKGHGEWVDCMQKFLGKTGIIRKMDHGQNKAVVEMGNNRTICWNTKLLTVVNKSAEMISMFDS